MGWCPSTAGLERGKLGSLESCKAEVIGKSSKGPPLPLVWDSWTGMALLKGHGVFNCLCVM